MADGPVESAVGVADAVDDGPILRQAEDAGARVAALWARREGARFDESEPCGRQFADRFAVGIEARGQADRVGEAAAEDLAFEGRMVHGAASVQQPASAGNHADQTQREEYDAVRLLDREREENRFYEAAVHLFDLSENAAKVQKKRADVPIFGAESFGGSFSPAAAAPSCGLPARSDGAAPPPS